MKYMKCTSCKRKRVTCAGSITVDGHGDYYDHAFFHCAACDRWTERTYVNRFMSEDDVWVTPIAADDAIDRVERIRRCPEPGNRYCACDVHRGWDAR